MRLLSFLKMLFLAAGTLLAGAVFMACTAVGGAALLFGLSFRRRWRRVNAARAARAEARRQRGCWVRRLCGLLCPWGRRRKQRSAADAMNHGSRRV